MLAKEKDERFGEDAECCQLRRRAFRRSAQPLAGSRAQAEAMYRQSADDDTRTARSTNFGRACKPGADMQKGRRT